MVTMTDDQGYFLLKSMLRGISCRVTSTDMYICASTTVSFCLYLVA